jgi:hypothetical protein
MPTVDNCDANIDENLLLHSVQTWLWQNIEALSCKFECTRNRMQGQTRPIRKSAGDIHS